MVEMYLFTLFTSSALAVLRELWQQSVPSHISLEDLLCYQGYLLSNTLLPPELSRWDMTALCSADFHYWSPISDQMASHKLPPSDCLCYTNLIASLRLWEMEDCPLCSAESLWTETSCMENHHFYRDRWSEAAGGWSPEPLCYQWFMWHL